MDRVCPFCANYYKFEEAVQNYGLCIFCQREIPSAAREARKMGLMESLDDTLDDEFEDDEFAEFDCDEFAEFDCDEFDMNEELD